MKTITARSLLVGLLFLLCMAPLIWAVAGWSMEGQDIPAVARTAEEVRCQLLTEAMERVGACSAEDAARLWADGVKGRSGAMQYAALSSRLKKDYAAALETFAPNWVTGGSSPWVQQYEIVKADRQTTGQYTFQLRFDLESSAGPAETLGACLVVEEEGGIWRVVAMAYDDGLVPYTGYRP